VKRIHIAAVRCMCLDLDSLWQRVQTSGQNGDTAVATVQSARVQKQTSNVQVEGEGVVTRLLADDLSGSTHQRFIVRLKSGQTVLIAHNIDIAPRSPGCRKAMVYASTASTCGTKRAVCPLDAPRPKGGTRQVGSNTEGGHISNTL